ncbi:serine/threonine-protein kinase [Labrys neptuniae]|uniref:serine/threonine-protein kinase n=1 Tax=Labrys neptuniae TaxID=376174 RepID=UPI00288E4461|nr:serine/threonine-protein kinase [Labrys neptuniae]MDT3381437.1 serine/threonine-protein kinase [Labrys neptuniae]
MEPSSNDERTRIAIRGSAVSIGAELNQTYRIDALLGVGGMGEVYKGHNIQTGDPVAIKIVLPEFAEDETILGLFRKEARILNHLYHEAIVRYYVFSIDPALSRPYLAMEYVDGPSLAAHVKNAPLTAAEFMPLLRRLADGLHRAHLAGVIHRDMSPDNVILPGGLVQNAKIIDFGIARSANVGGETLLGGSFAGKYNFVSPEQLGLFGGEVTPKSDIYSLALVMAAAMRGRALDMTGSQLDIIEKRRNVPDLDGVPRQFHAVLAAMLAPDPAGRPEDMAAIRDWPDGPATPKAKAEKPKAEKPKAVAARSSEASSTRPSHVLRNTAFAVTAVAVIGLGVAGGWIYTEGGLFSGNTPPIGGQPDNKQPDGNSQETLARQESERRERLGKQLASAGQDVAALKSFLDQCGADCPDDLARQARDSISTQEAQAKRRADLANRLASAGQDVAALKSFLDQCGADCPDDLARQARGSISTQEVQAKRRADLANQLASAGQDVAALKSFLEQCGADCPGDLAQQARTRIDAAKELAVQHDRLAAQLTAAGKNAAALRRFLDQCGADCPDDLAAKAKAALEGTKLAAVTSPTPAALRDFVAGFGADSCFSATADDVTASSASVTALGTAATDQSFADAFKLKAGFAPTVKLDAVSDQQCGFVGALRRMSVVGAPPLKMVLSKAEIRGGDADKGTPGDPLTVSVTGAGERNIYLFVMDHKGGIQNINRLCASCITMKTGEIEAGLSLSAPAKIEGEARPAFFPMLVFAVASSRPLISINAQDAFEADDFIAPFLKEIANARDVTTAVGYLKLRDQ